MKLYIKTANYWLERNLDVGIDKSGFVLHSREGEGFPFKFYDIFYNVQLRIVKHHNSTNESAMFWITWPSWKYHNRRQHILFCFEARIRQVNFFFFFLSQKSTIRLMWIFLNLYVLNNLVLLYPLHRLFLWSLLRWLSCHKLWFKKVIPTFLNFVTTQLILFTSEQGSPDLWNL